VSEFLSSVVLCILLFCRSSSFSNFLSYPIRRYHQSNGWMQLHTKWNQPAVATNVHVPSALLSLPSSPHFLRCLSSSSRQPKNLTFSNLSPTLHRNAALTYWAAANLLTFCGVYQIGSVRLVTTSLLLFSAEVAGTRFSKSSSAETSLELETRFSFWSYQIRDDTEGSVSLRKTSLVQEAFRIQKL
jgi:hypothetical protein